MKKAERLRQIADYLDSVENLMLNVWLSSADPRKNAAVAEIRSRGMQDDLRRWAAYEEERAAGPGAGTLPPKIRLNRVIRALREIRKDTE
jgi:hypothetical protein